MTCRTVKPGQYFSSLTGYFKDEQIIDQVVSLRAFIFVEVGMPTQTRAISCQLANIFVSSVLIVSPVHLPWKDNLVTLQFGVAALQGKQEVPVITQATIRNRTSSDHRRAVGSVRLADSIR